MKFQPLLDSITLTSELRGCWRLRASTTPEIVDRRKRSRTAADLRDILLVIKAKNGETVVKAFEMHFEAISIQFLKSNMGRDSETRHPR